MSKFILSAFADEAAEDLKTQMDVMELNEINYIEMRNVNGKSIVHHSLKEVEEIKKELDRRNFKISAVGSPIGKINITDDFEPHLELFRHTLKVAQILETEYIRMFSFFIPEGESPDTYRQEVMNRWSEFMAEAEGTGLVLLHENEKDIYGDTPERCLDLIKTMNSSRMKAIFDPANFVQCGVETYPKAYEMLKEHIEYLHIKDALYKDNSVVPAGHGDGRIKEMLTALHESGFEGVLSIEPHLGNFSGFAQLERNPVMNDLPEGGPQKFVIAADAIKKIIKEVTGE